MTRYVIDTNVLIVASGEHVDSPFSSNNHPIEDSANAKLVFDWLNNFEKTDLRMVLDSGSEIYREYRNKLTDQDYGLMVYRDKLTKCEYDHVTIAWDISDGQSERVAVLEKSLTEVVYDRSDRKFVAACIEARDEYGQATIVNACDTDWLNWEQVLSDHGIVVEQIIEGWLRGKRQARQIA